MPGQDSIELECLLILYSIFWFHIALNRYTVFIWFLLRRVRAVVCVCNDRRPNWYTTRQFGTQKCFTSTKVALLSSRLLSKNLKIKIYRTIILPVVLYGCEAWSLTLREEMKLRVYENMVLRRIFGPRRDEVTGECRRLHNEELNDLYSSPNTVRVIKSRRLRWVGHVARKGWGEGGV